MAKVNVSQKSLRYATHRLMVMHPHTWMILSKTQLFDLEVKGQVPRSSLQYATHHLMVMHPHTKYHWPISKDKNAIDRTRKYFLKNNYLTLRSKVKVHEGHYGMRHTALWSCTHILEYYLKKQLFDLKVKVLRRSLWYATHHHMVMHPHTKYHWPISKHKNVMAQTRKYYLKKYYFTLRSKVNVPRRSLWYTTDRLMVMHPHTKYHCPIS